MKLINLIGIAAIIFGVVSCGGEKKEKGIPEKVEAEEMVYYTCSMESHKHVHSEDPGNCPECGMKMVPAVKTNEANAEFYGCPMPDHSHIRHDEPGSCEVCGMKLIPIRLTKS